MDAVDRWVEIKRYARQSDAEADALALVAIGIGSRIVEREVGLALVVAGPDALRADHELAEYNRENQIPAPMALRPSHEGLGPALAYAAILMFVHGAASRDVFGLDWWTAGYAQAGLTVGGEWWRTVTALTLHADLGHLAGNVLAGSVFGVALAQFLGPGLAWFSILIAAAIANGLNALAHPASHTAVGASTAVFAALGLISVLSWKRKAVPTARGMRGWLPLVAGLALLVDLGTGGERTDVGAHAFGFIVGVAFGAGLLLAGARIPTGHGAQITCAAGAFLLLGSAWAWALASH
jgi:rhomboid protease GluP